MLDPQRQVVLHMPKVSNCSCSPAMPVSSCHRFRQLLLCRVTLGKMFLQLQAMKMAHAPPGHHSVVGKPSTGGLTYPEYVVYRGEQVRRYIAEVTKNHFELLFFRRIRNT